MALRLRLKKDGILDHFHGTPRPQQVEALKQLEDNWDKYDVFILELPVALGKTRIAHCIAQWNNAKNKKKTRIITPTNLLVEQYKETFPRLHVLKRQDSYRCDCYPEDMDIEMANCKNRKQVEKEFCPTCSYLKAVRQSYVMPYMASNYHVYMVHKLYSNTLVVDEAHNLVSFIRGMAGKRLWHKDYHYPSWVTSYGLLLKWINSLSVQQLEVSAKLKLLKEELETGRLRYLVELGEDEYRGQTLKCIKLLPIDVSKEKPILWPTGKKNSVEKIVLMSATINEVDVAALGLDQKRVLKITTGSAISVEKRPLVYDPIINMALAYQPNAIPELAKFIEDATTFYTETKGLVHVTYSVALKVQQYLSNPRILFHDQENKTDVYNMWRDSDPKEGLVLIGAGMSEGLDLAGSDYTWQIISKVPYPSLEDLAMRHLAETNPKSYAWDTLRQLCQSYGRICRTPDDYGITYILDKQFELLLKRSEEYGITPNWFKEAVYAPQATGEGV